MKEFLVLRHLYPSVREHRRVEAEVLRELREVLPAPYVAPAPRPPGFLRYVEKNAFSILFLAIYRALGIPPERRHLYGLINRAVRGLVTATDNLLDDEYKEMLPLAFPAKATRFKSVMHILIFDRILAAVLERAVDDGVLAPEDRGALAARLFHALVPIGSEEASEEGGVERLLTPEEILQDVHARKGCDLLCLAFVAPRLLERERAGPLTRADRGVCSIGLALQMVDDLVDVGVDLRDRRHNYLVSTVWHEGTEAERTELRRCLDGSGDCPLRGEDFPHGARLVMERAIGTAVEGFRALEQAGFWLGPDSALPLLRRLFYLRGAGALWELGPGAGTGG